MSNKASQFLEGQKIQLAGHPPNSPDLAPSDFYLFLSVKNILRSQRFSSREVAVDVFKMHVLEILQIEWKKFYENLFQRYKSALIIMANILKSNKTTLNDRCLFVFDIPDI
ncbi:hypothetical protein EVAR_23308_1 [Eumeta japonica]|uniref:Histone-lysine N-methyltransferase SETMAR n=1 Tax=Eumeta variegata TaxID=151549 RepID=A0A4C1Y0U6_EUMVA|nr:hypothetical protein EVAR_23308_1 [Eumeta japonica]